MKSINVRLTPADAAAVRKLKSQGQNISSIIRDTLHERASKPPAKRRRITKAEIRSVLAEVDALQEGEVVPEYIRLGVDPSIRQQASAYVRLRLAKRMKGIF